jgi:hypothetical protein
MLGEPDWGCDVGDLVGLVKYLYTDFILRDVFCKVAPGSLVLLGFVAAVTGRPPGDLVQDVGTLPIVVVLAGLGITWSLGFVAQQISFIISRPFLKPFAKHRFKKEDEKTAKVDEDELGSSIFRREFVSLVRRRTGFNAGHQKALERLSIIKEATGNLAVATMVFLGFWFIEDKKWLLGDKTHSAPLNLSWPWISLVTLALAAVLLILHFDHYCKEIDMQWEIEKNRKAGEESEHTGAPERVTYVVQGTLARQDEKTEA